MQNYHNVFHTDYLKFVFFFFGSQKLSLSYLYVCITSNSYGNIFNIWFELQKKLISEYYIIGVWIKEKMLNKHQHFQLRLTAYATTIDHEVVIVRSNTKLRTWVRDRSNHFFSCIFSKCIQPHIYLKYPLLIYEWSIF